MKSAVPSRRNFSNFLRHRSTPSFTVRTVRNQLAHLVPDFQRPGGPYGSCESQSAARQRQSPGSRIRVSGLFRSISCREPIFLLSADSAPVCPASSPLSRRIFGLSSDGSQASFASPTYISGGRISGKPDQSDGNDIYYSPSEMYQIYNSSSLHSAGYNGSGITIAIIDAYGDPYVQEELDNFSTQFNLPQLTLNQICVDGPVITPAALPRAGSRRSP